VENYPQKIGSSIFLNFYDFPGNFDIKEGQPKDLQKIAEAKSIIYLIDVQQEPYKEPIQYFINIYQFLIQNNPKAQIHILIHKTDDEYYGVEERKNDMLRKIKESIKEEIDASYKHKKRQGADQRIQYHLTSIYDHSLFDSFSKITQKVLPHKQFLVNLLDKLVLNSKMEKVFLFDVLSKIAIATDTQPGDIESFSICSDMIDVFLDISFIYGNAEDLPHDNEAQSIIKLSNGTTLYLKEVERYMVLICIIKEKNFDRPFLIDHNIEVFKEGLHKILQFNE
jgi:Ras-related GTP-binding protein C/D